MHPILLNRARLALYLLAWAPFAAGQAFMLQHYGGFRWPHAAFAAAGLIAFYALVCLSPWYSCQFLPLRADMWAKLPINHAASAITAAGLFIGLAKILGAPFSLMFFMFSMALMLYLLATALHYVLFSFQSSREAETRAQEARILAREAELKALKAQINPHFLFNSLNSISALTIMDGRRAREMCLRLSEFLRSTLNLAEKETISLEQEVALARTYLEVERIRFGDRLRVEQTVGPHCESCAVPSLILQPLVENAVKHGIAGMVEGGQIRLDAACGDGVLHLVVQNDFDPEALPATRNGVGLANVRNRLRARYQNRASLITEVRDNRFRAELELPCEP